MKTVRRHVVKSSANESDRRFAKRIQLAFRFLMFGESIDRNALEDVLGAERRDWIEAAMSIGLFEADGWNQLRMNGLWICSSRVYAVDRLIFIADPPPHFST